MTKKKGIKKKAVSAVKRPEVKKAKETPEETKNVAQQPTEAKETTTQQVVAPPPAPVMKQVPRTKRKVQWVTGIFTNGDRYKIAAKIIARKIAADTVLQNSKDISEVEKQKMFKDIYEDAFRFPILLTQEASKMTWAEVSQSAIAYEVAQEVDYMTEWPTAPKSILFEPEQAEDKVAPPPPVKNVSIPAEEEKDQKDDKDKDEYEKAGLKGDDE